MMHFTSRIKREGATGYSEGSGGEAAPKEEPAEDAPKDEGLDDYGYEKQSEEAAPQEEGDKDKKGDPPPEATDGDGAEDEVGASGYGDDKEAGKPGEKKEENSGESDDKKVDDKQGEAGDEAKADEEFTLSDPGDLLEGEVASLTAFIKANKFSKEEIAAIVEYRKNEAAKAEKEFQDQKVKDEQAIAQREMDWKAEMKTDPDFGGESFMFNVKRSEKAFGELFPEIKKDLTERGGMLPPNVMRGLLRASKKLYGTGKLPQGDPSSLKSEDDKNEEVNPLDFYNS